MSVNIDDFELAYRRGFDHGVSSMAIMLRDGKERFDLDKMQEIARKMRLTRREIGMMSHKFIERCYDKALRGAR